LESKNQYTQDKLTNVFAIYSSGNKDVEIEEYRKNTELYTEKYKESLKCMQISTAISTMIVITTYLMLIIVPSLLFWNGEIPLFLLTSIIITVIYYVPCIIDLNAMFPRVANDIGVLASSEEFIKELYDVHVKNEAQQQVEASNKESAGLTGINRSDIVIRNLSFEYLPGKPVFENFNLTITERQHVAIVGPSGNGKSTLIKLIMGYYSIPDGHIFMGGKDLNQYAINDLRKQITYVHQQPQLFNLSVLENIQYGNGASRESIIDFMDKQGLAAIFRRHKGSIEDLTNHYDFLDTRVGIDGGNLSGGQKQMVLILRALMTPKPFVILDEPTTAIDKDNKDFVIRAIALLCQNATVIIITHERELLALADRVITIDSGIIKNDEMISRIGNRTFF